MYIYLIYHIILLYLMCTIYIYVYIFFQKMFFCGPHSSTFIIIIICNCGSHRDIILYMCYMNMLWNGLRRIARCKYVDRQLVRLTRSIRLIPRDYIYIYIYNIDMLYNDIGNTLPFQATYWALPFGPLSNTYPPLGGLQLYN